LQWILGSREWVSQHYEGFAESKFGIVRPWQGLDRWERTGGLNERQIPSDVGGQHPERDGSSIRYCRNQIFGLSDDVVVGEDEVLVSQPHAGAAAIRMFDSNHIRLATGDYLSD